MRDKLKKKEDTIDKAMARAAKPKKTYVEPPKNLKPGATVKIVDMNQEATVLKEPDKNGNVRVQAGIIKMDVHITLSLIHIFQSLSGTLSIIIIPQKIFLSGLFNSNRFCKVSRLINVAAL